MISRICICRLHIQQHILNHEQELSTILPISSRYEQQSNETEEDNTVSFNTLTTSNFFSHNDDDEHGKDDAFKPASFQMANEMMMINTVMTATAPSPGSSKKERTPQQEEPKAKPRRSLISNLEQPNSSEKCGLDNYLNNNNNNNCFFILKTI